jgi:hypothetical protein
VDLLTVYDPNKSNKDTKVHVSFSSKNTLSRTNWSDYNNWSQNCTARDRIVFNDVKKGGSLRVKHWIKEGNTDNKVTVYSEPDSVSWAQLRELLGNPAVVMASSMAVPPKTARNASAGMMVFTGNYNNQGWNDVTVDLNAGGFYIDTNNKTPHTPHSKQVNLRDLLRHCFDAGLLAPDTKIYAAKGALKKKIGKLPNWKNVCSYVSSKVYHEHATNIETYNAAATVHEWDNLVGYNFSRNTACSLPWNLRDQNSAMLRFVKMQEHVKSLQTGSVYERQTKIAVIGRMLGIPEPKGTADPQVDVIVSEFKRRYPLLHLISSNWRDNFAEINHYVDIVDQNFVWFELSRPDEPVDDDN